MALPLKLTIQGTVGSQVVRVLINGTETPLTGRTYQATVDATSRIVTVTTVEGGGRESVRTLQLVTTAAIIPG